MSCRSTSGGRAVSSCATALTGCSAEESSIMIHRLKRASETGVDGPVEDETPPTVEEVTALLERYAFTVRNWEGLSARRRDAVLQRIDKALQDTAEGRDLPDRETFSAWSLLPYQIEAERIMGPPPSAELIAEIDSIDAPITHIPYYQKFTSIKKAAVTATKDLFDARPSTLAPLERVQVFHDWVERMSAIYDVPVPNLVVGQVQAFALPSQVEGQPILIPRVYLEEEQVINISSLSLQHLFHGYRSHLRHCSELAGTVPPIRRLPTEREIEVLSRGLGSVETQEEVMLARKLIFDYYDSRAWTLSLYATARPNLFQRMVREGQIPDVSPEDL